MAAKATIAALDLAAKRQFVAASSTFADMPADLVASFSVLCVEQQLADGQRIYSRNDAALSMYGIVRGAMRMSNVDEEGREAVLTYLEPGAWFGEISLFDGLPRSHDAYAVGAVTLLTVPKGELERLCEAQPALYRYFLLAMAAKLRLALAWIEDTTLLSFRGRLAKRLLSLVQTYGRPIDGGMLLDLRLSQEAMAAMLGVTRQTVNQEFKDWERRGVLKLDYGRITLCDLPALKALAER